MVGFISAFFTLVGIISYFIFIPLIQRSSKSKIFAFSLLVFSLSYLALAFTKSLTLFLIIATIMTITGTLRLTSFGLIIKDSSKKGSLSRNEGLMYTFTNTAYIVGPLVAGYTFDKSGAGNVFILAAIFIFLAFLLLIIEKIKDNRKQKRTNKNVLKNFFAFFKEKERVISYVIGGGVGFWWVLIYLFTPLYIIRSGLGGLWVGYFLFAIPIPLIILEYKFAKLAGKRGFKKLFQVGFLIAGISSLAAFFFFSNIFVVLGLLILASIGLAMLEPTVEAYFFDITNKKEEQRFYGPYNTRLEVASFIGKLTPSLMLLVLPFKFIFLFFSIAMFLLVLVSGKVKKVIERK